LGTGTTAKIQVSIGGFSFQPEEFGKMLLGFFVFYLWKASRAGTSEPELAGPAARIGGLPRQRRRLLVTALFVFAAAVIVACAEPFASSLITAGTELGIDKFLLVQWVAPLAWPDDN
jgi:cation:H+ antiporter